MSTVRLETQPARVIKADLARSMAFLQAISLLKQGSFTVTQAVKYLRREYKKAATEELRVG